MIVKKGFVEKPDEVTQVAAKLASSSSGSGVTSSVRRTASKKSALNAPEVAAVTRTARDSIPAAEEHCGGRVCQVVRAEPGGGSAAGLGGATG